LSLLATPYYTGKNVIAWLVTANTQMTWKNN